MSDGEGTRLTEIRIASRAEQLRLVRAAVLKAATDAGCSDQCVRDVVIAVDEACQNVIRHAYRGDPEGEIVVEIRRCGDRVVFDIIDFATPVDTSKIRPRALDDLRPGGLGTHFIHECMDEATFLPPPDGTGNLLRLIKRIS